MENDEPLEIENLENITHIGNAAFASSHIVSFPYWDNLKEIGYAAFGMSDIEYVKISQGCKVGESAFNYCLNLKTVDLPDDCPDDVSFYFTGSNAIQLIRIATVEPPLLSEDWAAKVAEGCVLEVPEGSEELYRSAPFWKNFATIRTSGVEAVVAAGFEATGLTGALRVSSATPAKVFDLKGNLIHTGTSFTLPLPAGLYLVESAGAVRKVQVK